MADHWWERCLSATTVADACHGLADDLVGIGMELPSVYLLVGQRLRCQAARGYFQVVDGFPTGTGVLGRVVDTGESAFLPDVSADPSFIAAIPGLTSEVAAPVRVHDRVVGGVNVESRQPLDVTALRAVEEAAAVLGRRLEQLGGLPGVSLAQRLAQASLDLTAALSAEDVTSVALRWAQDLAGMRAAAVVLLDGRPDAVQAEGELLRPEAWTSELVEDLRARVTRGTSSYFPGGDQRPTSLMPAGVRAISVHPMVLRGDLVGLLVLADDHPVPHTPDVVEALETLATQAAASLAVVDMVAELARRAEVDDLTGLGNAALFASDLRSRTAVGSGQDVLVCIDVDEFKAVNDGYGHLAGDRLLQALAVEMREVLRGTDRLYRIGGDEFAAIITTHTRDETAHVVERLLQAARRCRTTVSIGTSPLRGLVPEQARRIADERLYAAKARGRDCAEVA